MSQTKNGKELGLDKIYKENTMNISTKLDSNESPLIKHSLAKYHDIKTEFEVHMKIQNCLKDNSEHVQKFKNYENQMKMFNKQKQSKLLKLIKLKDSIELNPVLEDTDYIPSKNVSKYTSFYSDNKFKKIDQSKSQLTMESFFVTKSEQVRNQILEDKYQEQIWDLRDKQDTCELEEGGITKYNDTITELQKSVGIQKQRIREFSDILEKLKAKQLIQDMKQDTAQKVLQKVLLEKEKFTKHMVNEEEYYEKKRTEIQNFYQTQNRDLTKEQKSLAKDQKKIELYEENLKDLESAIKEQDNQLTIKQQAKKSSHDFLSVVDCLSLVIKVFIRDGPDEFDLDSVYQKESDDGGYNQLCINEAEKEEIEIPQKSPPKLSKELSLSFSDIEKKKTSARMSEQLTSSISQDFFIYGRGKSKTINVDDVENIKQDKLSNFDEDEEHLSIHKSENVSPARTPTMVQSQPLTKTERRIQTSDDSRKPQFAVSFNESEKKEERIYKTSFGQYKNVNRRQTFTASQQVMKSKLGISQNQIVNRINEFYETNGENIEELTAHIIELYEKYQFQDNTLSTRLNDLNQQKSQLEQKLHDMNNKISHIKENLTVERQEEYIQELQGNSSVQKKTSVNVVFQPPNQEIMSMNMHDNYSIQEENLTNNLRRVEKCVTKQFFFMNEVLFRTSFILKGMMQTLTK